MRNRSILFGSLILAIGIALTSCGKDDNNNDTCSNDIGDIGPSYQCTAPVEPVLCIVDGEPHHWILDGVEYACVDADCVTTPPDMVTAIKNKPGCSGKSASLESNAEVSAKAKEIFANLMMDATLCDN